MQQSRSYPRITFCLITALLIAPLSHTFAESSTIPDYSNTYISYNSPSYVESLMSYSHDNHIGGTILWEITGDLPVSDDDSLLAHITSSATAPQYIEAFWPDWSTERNYDPDNGLPVASAGTDKYQDPLKGQKLQDQITAMETNSTAVLAFAFMETNADGYLIAHDPWADLQPSDAGWCSSAGVFCGSETIDSSYTHFGSVTQFVDLKKENPQLKTILSLGGWGHEFDVQKAYDNSVNFIDSYDSLNAALKNSDHEVFHGIDFDFEQADKVALAKDFPNLVTLIQQFQNGHPDDFISIDLMGDDEFIQKLKDDGDIDSLTDIGVHINIMSYDFHGAFDYGTGGSNQTGLLSRLYTDSSEDPKDFSVEKEITALGTTDPTLVGLGVAAYGRTISNVTSVDDSLYHGTLTSDSVIPIEYDLDDHGSDYLNYQRQPDLRCDQHLGDPNYPLCDGMYPWSYIRDQMLKAGGFEQTYITSEQEGSTIVSGVYAQKINGWTPAAPADYLYTTAIDVVPNFYYNNMVINDEHGYTVTVNELSADSHTTTSFPTQSNDNSLTFTFSLDNEAYSPFSCVIGVPKDGSGNIDYTQPINVVTDGSPYQAPSSPDAASCSEAPHISNGH